MKSFAEWTQDIAQSIAPKTQHCETCGGTGEIDETLGGESFSDPHAKCPDCDGTNTIDDDEYI